MSNSFETLWTVACLVPQSVEFSRQEYWSGLPFPPPGDLPDLVIEPVSPALADRFFTAEPPEKTYSYSTCILINFYLFPMTQPSYPLFLHTILRHLQTDSRASFLFPSCLLSYAYCGTYHCHRYLII